MNKILIAVLLCTGMLGVFSNCCSDVKEYWKMDSFELNLTDKNLVVLSDSTSVDTLLIGVMIDPVYFAQELNPLNSLFVSNSFATSCPHPGHSGLKSKLTTVSIFSDEEFNGYAAGSDLRALCTFDGLTYLDYIEKVNGFSLQTFYNFQINTKPSQSIPRTFRVVFQFADGEIRESTSQEIVWY